MPEGSELVDRRRLLRQRRRAREELRLFNRRLSVLLAVVLVVLISGMLGFAAIEGTSPGYGFVWTLDTSTTLGAIPAPRDVAGRALQVGLELFGIGTLFYGFATVAEFFVSGQLSGLLRERRAQRMIDSYSDHFIICGFGRVGRQVARDLRAAGVDHVVVDDNPENRELAGELGVPYIGEEPAEDRVLREAGIGRAKAVIACVDSDAENIFITLTARELRSDILIIARASAEGSEQKLVRAGADRVVSPYKTSGSEMARVALHPQVAGAVEVADFRVEEIEVREGCEGVGKTVDEARGSSVIVALRRADGRLEPQPSPREVIEPGDIIVALGNPAALEQLERLFQPARVAGA